ncbi:VacJ family lipoprotein [Primorskyibacter aestuariivivens]|uniref:MlaA family lipoprotein n=1 Tax=Primorskyibacter aestuariivivens TaxID=1888912 RepID=UPI0022FFCFFA|nr:VacJ family lipoprotein [Primorskyibacter aestuariivivens]MDA7428296.1 VacJ family lipoprotein [Primorskyibacter aestuariivivens]
MSFIANELRLPVLPETLLHSPIASARRIIAGLALVALAACTTPGPGDAPDGIFDPYEAQNRKVHESSKKFDKNVLRPVAVSYAESVPEPAQEMVSNFAGNLSVPGAVVNQVLQADLEGAFRNTIRFGLNSTLGFAGLFDVAREFGINEDDADFGQTLAVWGVPEGAYLELPLLGPSTERDAFGRVVDFVINPTRLIPAPESYYLTGTRIVARVGQRGRFASTVDSILYDSADSYIQTRLLYLQNRRHEIGSDAAQAEEIDPYEDLYGE